MSHKLHFLIQKAAWCTVDYGANIGATCMLICITKLFIAWIIVGIHSFLFICVCMHLCCYFAWLYYIF